MYAQIASQIPEILEILPDLLFISSLPVSSGVRGFQDTVLSTSNFKSAAPIASQIDSRDI